MELLATHLFICNASFCGVMKTTMLKDFHDVKLRYDFYKILTQDRQLIDMIKSNCEKDHTNVDTLKLVSTDNIYSKTLDYNDAENFLKYIIFIKNRDIKQDMLTSQKWIVEFKFNSDVNFFKIIMDSQQLYRLFSQVNNYYCNYLSYTVMAKQQSALEEEKIPKQEKKVTEYIQNQSVVETKPVVSPHELISRDRTELDDIFELCLSSNIKSSLINYTFNYFRFITDKHCNVRVSDKKQVQYILPLIMPGNFGVNEEYFSSLTLGTSSIPINNVTFAIKKILQNLLANPIKYKESSLYLMMMCYLLFIYMIRYLYESNKESYRVNFKGFINSAFTQSELLKRMIEVGFQDFHGKIFFKIINIDLAEIDENYNLEKINKLSEQYKHLIPVSQKEFADKIFGEANNSETSKEPKDFILSNKKVIDINTLIANNQKQQKVNQSIFFDSDHILDINPEINKEYNFLDYKLQSTNGSKVITKAYQYLLNYIKNPGSVLLLKDTDLPKEVVNLFDVLVKKVLNATKITKDNISTFNYYKILLESLPRPKEFKHTLFLFIIYQIIIPYSYDLYGNSQFEDHFL